MRTDIGASIPKNMFDYLRDADQFDLSRGTLQGNITDMNFKVNAYAEVGLGYSRPVNDKLTVGGRVKVLLGVAHAEMQVDEFAVDMNIPQNPDDPNSWNGTYGGSTTARAHIMTSIKGGGLSFADSYVIMEMLSVRLTDSTSMEEVLVLPVLDSELIWEQAISYSTT